MWMPISICKSMTYEKLSPGIKNMNRVKYDESVAENSSRRGSLLKNSNHCDDAVSLDLKPSSQMLDGETRNRLNNNTTQVSLPLKSHLMPVNKMTITLQIIMNLFEMIFDLKFF